MFQLCDKLNTLCSPEFNTIQGTCLELSRAMETSGLSLALWRGATGGCPKVQSQKRDTAAREAPGKGRTGVAGVGRSQTPQPGLQGSRPVPPRGGSFRSAGVSGQQALFTVKCTCCRKLVFVSLTWDYHLPPMSVSTRAEWRLTSFRCRCTLCPVLLTHNSREDVSFVLRDVYRLGTPIDIHMTT